jgi:asparagine synthase (glutamine-hydrolysing)
MCGICGQYNFQNKQPVNLNIIKSMTNTIKHRGPDDEGYHISGSLGLGFRRLSIIDLQGGHQPMSDKDETIWVVFNGEIYNYPELKEELKNYGYEFRTKSDTEVIIYGYKKWGADVFNHLNGMFGLAIWDEKKKKLILARDAMGIKLIYYKIDSGCLWFGSEVRTIIAAQNNKPEVDPVSLNLFLRYRYTPSPLTVFKGIKKLAPGTMLSLENGESKLERWYKFKPQHFSPAKKVSEAKEELLDIYKKALKRHLLSDVPVGLLLSGGIDSGLLLGLMNLSNTHWPTFTIGYGESFKDDELIDASKTAEIFSSKHTSIQLDKTTFENSLPNIVSFLEEPVATSSIVPMYFVCQRARQDVKVALVGQGPDELFGGYKRHLGIHYGDYWRKMPPLFQKSIESISKRLPRNESLKRGFYSLNVEDRMSRYQNVFSIIPGDAVDSLFQDDIIPLNTGDKILEYWQDYIPLMENIDELGGFQFIEIRSSLPDELLMYADKLSMAHSLEVRVPYLDKEIVEYVERLPASYKIRNGSRKWLHRQVCKDFLPKSFLKRKKRGFAVNVVDDWFYGSLGNKMDDILLDPASQMYQFLQHQQVKQMLDEHIAKKNDYHKILFSLVIFEEWLRQN